MIETLQLFAAVREYSYENNIRSRSHSTRNSNFNCVETHFRTLRDKVEGTKTAAALPHCSECTKESCGGWETMGSRLRLELWKNYANILQEKIQRFIEVLPVVDSIADSAKKFCFLVGNAATRVYGLAAKLSS